MPKLRSTPVKISTRVKQSIQQVLDEHRKKYGAGVRWQETFTYTYGPYLDWPYVTVVTLHGHTRFCMAHATYDSPYGRFQVNLKGIHGVLRQSWTKEEKLSDEVIEVAGTPQCVEQSNLYRETLEQRQARARFLVEQGIL